VEVNVRGGEGGIREVEKEYEGIGFMHSTRGENLEFWESWFTVGFTVHRGAEEVLGSEG
jgi:hypothetical protein